MRVAFRVDATDRIGGGHAMRCLTLADALREDGADTLFVCAALPASLKDRLLEAGHRLQMIARPDDLERERDDWHEPPLSQEVQERDAATTLAALGGSADWMVVDHYLLSQSWHRAARRRADRIMVIDDLANRPLECDLLLDETLGRATADYRPLVSRDVTFLTGADYVLLRPEFAQARPAALERRQRRPAVRRILVSLGMTDVDGTTEAVVASLLNQKRDWAIDVVLGPQAASLAAVMVLAARDATIQIHVDTSDMAGLMAQADFAIGAGGTSAWERCCVGLPSAILILAGNQTLVAEALSQAGAAVILTNAAQSAKAVARIAGESGHLAAMSAAAAAVTDGQGMARVVDHILGTSGAARTVAR